MADPLSVGGNQRFHPMWLVRLKPEPRSRPPTLALCSYNLISLSKNSISHTNPMHILSHEHLILVIDVDPIQDQ